MSRKYSSHVSTGFILGALLVCSCLVTSATAQGQGTQQLPISNFLSAVGATSYQSWYEPSTNNYIYADAYGKLNTFYNLGLDTTVTGKLKVQNLRGGMKQATVSLHTSDALCWGFSPLPTNFNILVPAFGYSRQELAANNTLSASVGDVMSRIVYKPVAANAGLYSGGWDTFSAVIMCDGELRAGSGYPNGTPGFGQTTQQGLYNTGAPGGCPPEQDGNCFPAEKVQFKPRGQ